MKEMQANGTYELTKTGYVEILKVSMDTIAALAGEKVVVLGGSKGDPLDTTQEMGEVLRKKNEGAKAYNPLDLEDLGPRNCSQVQSRILRLE